MHQHSRCYTLILHYCSKCEHHLCSIFCLDVPIYSFLVIFRFIPWTNLGALHGKDVIWFVDVDWLRFFHDRQDKTCRFLDMHKYHQPLINRHVHGSVFIRPVNIWRYSVRVNDECCLVCGGFEFEAGTWRSRRPLSSRERRTLAPVWWTDIAGCHCSALQRERLSFLSFLLCFLWGGHLVRCIANVSLNAP